MGLNMKGITRKERNMERENTYGAMEVPTRETGRRIKSLDQLTFH